MQISINVSNFDKKSFEEHLFDDDRFESEDPIDDFNCPQTMCRMQTVGTLSCGHNFEFLAIQNWVNTRGWRCPKGCGHVSEEIIDNKQMSNAIQDNFQAMSYLRNKVSKITKKNERDVEREIQLDNRLEQCVEVIEKNQKLIENFQKLTVTSREVIGDSEKLISEALQSTNFIKHYPKIASINIFSTCGKIRLFCGHPKSSVHDTLARGLDAQRTSKVWTSFL